MVAHLWSSCPVLESGALLPGAALGAYLLMISMSAVWLMQMLKSGVADFLVLRKGTSSAVPVFGSKKGVEAAAEPAKKL